MEATRIIDLFHFSRVRGRFIDSAFKNSSPLADAPPTPDGGGGISVIDTLSACPDADCTCLCRHIARYYGDLVDDPFAFWSFNTAILNAPVPNPTGIDDPQLVHDPIEGGDPHHWSIYHVTDKRADKVRKAIPFADVRLCINGVCEPFTVERAIELQDLREAIALDED